MTLQTVTCRIVPHGIKANGELAAEVVTLLGEELNAARKRIQELL